MRIIKLTEKQIREVEEPSFTYIDTENNGVRNVQSQIMVGGKLDDKEYANPLTTDKVANTMSNQGYNRFNAAYNYGRRIREGEHSEDEDKNDDGVDDFYNDEILDTLSNDTENDNLTRIPQSVQQKVDLLLQTMSTSNLTQKQQAIVLNKIIEKMNYSELPYKWKKELRLKIH